MDTHTTTSCSFAHLLREHGASAVAAHLAAWFQAGHAPNDWDEARCSDFFVWVYDHAAEYPYYVDWSTMAADYVGAQR